MVNFCCAFSLVQCSYFCRGWYTLRGINSIGTLAYWEDVSNCTACVKTSGCGFCHSRLWRVWKVPQMDLSMICLALNGFLRWNRVL